MQIEEVDKMRNKESTLPGLMCSQLSIDQYNAKKVTHTIVLSYNRTWELLYRISF